MPKVKKMLIISFTDLSKDPRVNRQIKFLKDEYEVTAVGINDPQIEGVRFISCGRTTRTRKEKLRDISKLLSRNYERYYWSAPHIKNSINKLIDVQADIVIANDIDSLPLALRISKNAKVVLDAHEYAPKEFEDLFLWRLLYKKYKEYLCSKYIKKTNNMITVCNGIASEYKKRFGVNATVVTNAPKYHDISLKKIDNNKIKMVFHGGASVSRKIENMIDMMDYVDERFTLDLILIGTEKYINYLKKRAQHNYRINFLSPVPMEEICSFISNYDIGIYLLEPNSFNNKMALPNKFFEFIQARLAIAIGPSPQMADIVLKYNCGIVSQDFNPLSLANCINKLDKNKIDYYRKQSDKLARIMCAEENKKIVLNLIENL